ncbi:RNA polymerase sigma factor [Kineosporia sp. R_H_3]|uniref:RNA polymerase sigma factor n=1 Tax=Kineosporia sp. R_H_3 TaxID=1961848 RepID=UPI0013046D6D|nr:sigma-70 family RNA polymerase sigma factor [Kineosporia sp. R_H_3]
MAASLVLDRDTTGGVVAPSGGPDAPTGSGSGLDPSVVDAFRAGDGDALAAVYDRYSRAVWSVAMTVLRDRALAEDATQETFLRAWRAAATFEPGRPLAPWLLTVARRTAVDVHRREARPTQGGHAAEQDVVVQLPGLEHVWEAWEVRLALDALPDDERAIIRMSHFEEMTHREIAEALDVPVGTVKSRSHRGHRRLAASLAHLVKGGDR